MRKLLELYTGQRPRRSLHVGALVLCGRQRLGPLYELGTRGAVVPVRLRSTRYEVFGLPAKQVAGGRTTLENIRKAAEQQT